MTPDTLTKLSTPPAGAHALPYAFLDFPANERIAWDTLNLLARKDPRCSSQPLGYLEETRGDYRLITVYWPAMAEEEA